MSEDFDYFFHYDSTSNAVADNKLSIGAPANGAYWIHLTNIHITYADGVTPDPKCGFLVLEGTEEIQSSGICAAGSRSSKLYFPLSDSGSSTPLVKTYNRILLRTSDTVALVCHNSAFEKLTTARIVATIHISSNSKIIRASAK
jgi:hypothetical protein